MTRNFTTEKFFQIGSKFLFRGNFAIPVRCQLSLTFTVRTRATQYFLPFYFKLLSVLYHVFLPSNGTDALNFTGCHPAAVEEFPEDLFTADHRESGAIIVHVAAAVYLIIALGASVIFYVLHLS